MTGPRKLTTAKETIETKKDYLTKEIPRPLVKERL